MRKALLIIGIIVFVACGIALLMALFYNYGYYHVLDGSTELYKRLRLSSIVSLVTGMYEFIRDFKGDVPGASPKDCGNYLDMNLGMAKFLAKRYLDNTLYNIDDKHLVYPE